MVLLRCAIVGRAVVTPVRVPLDATVHELQCAVEASVPLLVPCDRAHLRLFRATPRASSAAGGASLQRPQWLQMDDPALEALLAPHSSAAHTDACALRCTYLDPLTELLPEHTLRAALHCDSATSSNTNSNTNTNSTSNSTSQDDEPTSPSGADVHVLVALPDEPALAQPAAPPHKTIASTVSRAAPAPGLHDTDTDADDDMDAMALPLTDDPHLLQQLEEHYNAMSGAYYELKPAHVPTRAVAALRYRLARYDAEYGIVLSQERRRRRCVELIVAAVCDLLPSDGTRKPELLARVTLPSDAHRVLAKFDFTLELGAAHVGIVVATQAPESTGMRQALQQSWLGAEVLADTDRSRRVFGIVTNYVDWVFLRYTDDQIYAREVTLEVGCNGVPMKASLAEIIGLVLEMMLGT